MSSINTGLLTCLLQGLFVAAFAMIPGRDKGTLKRSSPPDQGNGFGRT
jgi:hypothetical protein